jgi:hypothetical protein
MQEFSTNTNPGWTVQGGFKQLASGAAPPPPVGGSPSVPSTGGSTPTAVGAEAPTTTNPNGETPVVNNTPIASSITSASNSCFIPGTAIVFGLSAFLLF